MERAEAEAVLDGDREVAVVLLMRVGELVEANRRLEARVGELEQRLSRRSRNSSLPPSQDPPSLPPRAGKSGSARGRGGQSGHEGRHRRLLPPERVDEVIDYWPGCCGRCAHRFGEDERIEVASAQRHQVAELPPIAVRVSEYRLHRLRCPECAAQTRAELPAELPRCATASRVATPASSCVNCLATGSVDAIVQRTGEALEQPQARLAEQIRSAAAVNIDETGWRTAAKRRTLWGALTGQAAFFHIAADRHQREAKALLGDDFAGVACSDRWWAYNYLEPEQRQVCWAHLVRDFTAHSEGMAAQKQFGEAGLEIAQQLFAAWHDYRHDGDRARLLEQISPLEHELRTLLQRAARNSTKTKYQRRFATNLLKLWPALWTFSHTDGVEPTNNHAERGLRGAVIYRKLPLGSQTEQGERSIERLLSASITCRLQHRSLYAHLTHVLTANTRGDPIPTLT